MLTIPALLQGLIGQRVIRMDRVLYQVRGDFEKVVPGDGPLELELEGGRVLLLDGAGDGESLRAKEGTWVDLFAEPLSEENARFVEESGKWTRVPSSRLEGYIDFIGERITEVSAIAARDARGVAGVRLSVAKKSLWFVVQWDECHVLWEAPKELTEAGLVA
jgi:hypothetical protein